MKTFVACQPVLRRNADAGTQTDFQVIGCQLDFDEMYVLFLSMRFLSLSFWSVSCSRSTSSHAFNDSDINVTISWKWIP